MSKIIYAYAYTRYSSHNQDDGNSIKAQEDGIKNFVNSYPEKIKILNTYSDKAISGMTDDRPEYKKMISDIKKTDNVSCIIVHRLDRLHRNTRNQLNIVYELLEIQKRILTADGIDTSNSSDMSRLLDAATAAEKYALNLKEETLKGLKENAKECIHNGGVPPYGYKLDINKKLEIDPVTAPAVKKIFEMKKSGMSYGEIIEWLDINKYFTVNNKSFSESTLIGMLRNEKYKGVFTWDKSASKDFRRKRNSHKVKETYIRKEGGCPAIVSEELFNEVQESFKKQRQKSKYNYLVKDKIYCAECNQKFKINTQYKKTGEPVPKYIATCKCHSVKSINQLYLDDMIVYALRECVFSYVNINDLIEKVNSHVECISEETEPETELLNSKIKDCTRRRDNLIKAISNGLVSESVTESIRVLDEEINDFELRMQKLLSAKRVFTEKDLYDIKNIFSEYMLDERNEDVLDAINDTVERVDVGTDKITVTFKGGIKVSSDTKKNFN